MRSYGQYCALARALDVVGDRWTLLIIRELFAGDRRYSDLRDGLPGIATNLLADRLRKLREDGVVESYDAPRPVHATVYRLTLRGRALAPALRALVAWGAPLLTAGKGDDAFRTRWLVLGLPALFEGRDVRDLAPLTVHVHTGDEPATIDVGNEGLTTRVGATPNSDAVTVGGEPADVYALLTGTAETTTPPGVSIRGPREAIQRLHALAARSRLASPQRHETLDRSESETG